MGKGLGVRNLYNHTYESYDELYREEQLEKYFIALRRLKPSGKVLDVGCGTALLLEFLAVHNLLDHVDLYVCLDYSPNMLSVAERRIRALCKDRCLVVLGDAQRLPFRDNSFDIVYSFTVIDLLDDPRKGLEELLRVSKRTVVVSFLKRLGLWKSLGLDASKSIGESSKDIMFMINK